MTVIFAILLILAETALVVLTFPKRCEQAQWRKNRAIVRAIEFLLLLGIVLLPATHLKWRYAGALILLGVLLLIAAIGWLLWRNKTTGSVRKSRVVGSAALSVLLVTGALVPAFVFSNYDGLKTTGAYGIRTADAILVDADRLDPFETDGSHREIPVHFYYPDADGSFPLIVFSHGAFGYYQSNYSTYAELASNGYVVASLDHPHHAFFARDTDGRTVPVDNGFLSDAIDVENGAKSEEEVFAVTREWMQLRTADMNYVLDTIEAAKAGGTLDGAWHAEHPDEILSVLGKTDVSRIGLLGHSMGGATAVSLGRTRSDVGAVIVLDGTMLDEITALEDGVEKFREEPYPVPVLDFGKTSDYSELERQNLPAYAYVNAYVVEHAIDGKTVLFDGVGHMDFTDLPLFSPLLASLLGSENIDHAAFLGKVNGLVRNWFDYYLKGTGTRDLPA